MSQTHIVFNNQIDIYAKRFISKVAQIPSGEEYSEEVQKRKILALLFEQFLLFDKIAVKIDRENLPLFFLIKELGLNKIEELLDHRVIIPVLWTPMIIASQGMTRPDGSIDREAVIGQPPLVSGRFSEDDSDPEKSIDRLLGYFNVNKDRKRIFKKRVLKHYILPNNSISDKATEIVVDAYNKNRLAHLGLQAIKEADQLDYLERGKLLDLGNQVLETTILAEEGFKSYDNYSYFSLTKDAVRNIEAAYHVSENTSQILKVENLANIQHLVFENRIPFERVFDIRYQSNIKQYRKWINSLSVSTDTKTITKEYIDEIVGKKRFFESNLGKFVRTVGMFGVGTGVGAAIGGIPVAAAGAAIGKGTDLALSLLDSHVLDGILKGWNPRMFVDQIRLESEDEASYIQ